MSNFQVLTMINSGNYFQGTGLKDGEKTDWRVFTFI